MPYSLADMVLYFFFYSFCGWLMETVLCSFREHRFINRGFLGGPICPIYGCGVSLMLFLLIPVRDGVDSIFNAVVVIFLSGTVLATAVEYFISWLMEKLFHARWWDYSHMKFNINGRVSLIISLIWGGLATAFLYFVQPLFENFVSIIHRAGESFVLMIVCMLIILLIVDIIVSSLVARRIGNKLDQLDKWAALIRGFLESLELPSKDAIIKKIEGIYERLVELGSKSQKALIKENNPIQELGELAIDALKYRLAEYSNELRKKREELMASTRYLQRRMLRAFPHLKYPQRIPTSLREWKDYIIKKNDKNK